MQSDKRILTHNLRVHDFTSVADFYCKLLGMRMFEETSKILRLGYHSETCHIVFRQKELSKFIAQPNDFYWKVGITVPNLDASVAFLKEAGTNVSEPVQFRDIGYMSKITDPNGFVIELLQHGFEGNAKPTSNGHPVGAQATLAHITLRVTDIVAAKKFFGKTLGMRLMSVQPVDAYGFCLYFYTWSEEVLPDPALESVQNREWLWARPYTFIELQHLQAQEACICKTALDAAGFDGFSYGSPQTKTPSLVPIEDLHRLR